MTTGLVAVTGGTGFLGKRLVQRLCRRGVRVRCLSRRPSAVPAEAEALMWDSGEGPDPSLLEGVTVLVHAAAHVPERHDDPNEALPSLMTNALGTLHLMHAAADAGVRRIVHVSTGNLYLQQQSHVALREEAPIYPAGHASFYLASKATAEIWATHVATTNGISAIMLRPSSIYGPGMRHGVVRTMVDRLGAGNSVIVSDGGRFASDLVYVDDVISVIETALQSDTEGALNVGSGTTTTVAELARCVAYLVGAPPEAITIEPPHGQVNQFAALDITRAREHLAFAPTGIREGLTAMIAEEAPQ